jgi:hypothetical protein
MKGRAEVFRLKSRLDSTFARMPLTFQDIELQSDFARHLCILVSGFFENAISALVLDFAQRRSSPEVAAFVESELKYWTNPNTDKICLLLGSFNRDWRIQAEAYLIDELKASVNSLVALRHKIAHGESVGTSLSQVKAYYKSILRVIDFIADLLEPSVKTSP